MIKDLRHPQVVMALENSTKYEFYLTGSRFFTPKTASISDYDFFVCLGDHSELPALQEYLKSEGYVQTSLPKYHGDPAILEIWTRASLIPYLSVDVQIIRPEFAYAKERTQMAIYRDFRLPYNNMDKQTQKQLWRMMVKLAQ